MRLFLSLFLFLFVTSLGAASFNDADNCDFLKLFQNGKGKYNIRYHHHFSDTLYIPDGCELYFDGGSVSGPLVFTNTRLSGSVNLKGSSIRGRIRNRIFDASWLCVMDGVSDDAACINDMISVCDHIYFPKGVYRLISEFNVSSIVPHGLESSVKAHVGISRSGISLVGEEGALFVTNKPIETICVFSQPNQIEKSIHDIIIDGIQFTVKNDGKEFHELSHTIKIVGVNGIVIKNCLFNDFWGDAICLSHYGDTPSTGERTLNQNVCILNNTIIGGKHHNNRNGISVISGKNVLIKNNVISNTSRKDMPGGIDVEPNNSAYTIENIRIEDNTLSDIKGSGGAICVVVYDEGPAHGISILRNKIKRSTNGVFIYVKTQNTTDGYVIKGNEMDSKTRPFYFVGTGLSKDWEIGDNIYEQSYSQTIPGDIKVENLIVRNNKKKGYQMDYN